MLRLNEQYDYIFIDTKGADGTGDPLGKTRLAVTLDQLVPYDHNPRQSRNPKYEEIKDSIRNRGLDNIPKITRRQPGDVKFMIKDGGNTRLEILRELYDETGDERFYRIECDFEPWAGEIDAMAGHMAENELRGDLLFIEKANAAARMRRLIEEQQGDIISGRELARQITKNGWTLNSQNLTRYEYAVSCLLPLVPTALWAGMGHSMVMRLRKLEKSYQEYWTHHKEEPENSQGAFHLIWYDVLKNSDAETLDVDAIQKALDIAVPACTPIRPQKTSRRRSLSCAMQPVIWR